MSLDSAHLMDFIVRHFSVDVADVESDCPLFSSGLLDSIDLIDLINYIEKHEKTRIKVSEVHLDNLDSVDRITRFLRTRDEDQSAGQEF